jgi:hypothetical protein
MVETIFNAGCDGCHTVEGCSGGSKQLCGLYGNFANFAVEGFKRKDGKKFRKQRKEPPL